MSGPFKIPYSALKRPGKELRLIELAAGGDGDLISGQFRNDTIAKTSVPYGALSYTWGDSNPTEAILIDGANVKIPANLYEALLRLRKTDTSRLLWIDALCINQGDNNEKVSQVKMMHRIYANTAEVILWLGPEKESSPVAFELFETLGKKTNSEYEQYEETDCSEQQLELLRQRKFRDAVSELRSRSYWDRAWIVQEIFFAGKVTIMCGTSEIDGRTMTLALKRIRWGTERILKDFVAGRDLAIKWNQLQRQSSTEMSSTKSILDILLRNTHRHASDPRDMIYAFLNLPSVESKKNIPIFYDRTNLECCTAFALWHIETTKTLDILSYADHTKEPWVQSPDLGSWVPCWPPDDLLSACPILAELTEKQSLDMATKHLYSACGNRRIEYGVRGPVKHSLVLRGHFVDKVKTLGSKMPYFGIASNSDSGMKATYNEWEAMCGTLGLTNRYSNRKEDLIGGPRVLAAANCPIDGFALDEADYDKRTRLTEAFWRTLIGDKELMPYDDPFGRYTPADTPLPKEPGPPDPAKPGRAQVWGWNGYVQFRKRARSAHVDDPVDVYSAHLIARHNLLQFTQAMGMAAESRRFCITEKGYMGLVSASTKVGDHVALVEGSQTPLILRWSGRVGLKGIKFGAPEEVSVLPIWGLIGDSYVHGMMDGEAWPDDASKEPLSPIILR